MGAGTFNKQYGNYDPDEPKMEVPVDWDDQDVKLEADRYEVEDWDIEIE